MKLSFGWGTLLTNDFRGLAPDDALAPFSLVCKAVSANGRPTVKLSDNPAKAIGPADRGRALQAGLRRRRPGRGAGAGLMTERDARLLERQLDRLAGRMPSLVGRLLDWHKSGGSRWLRVPVGLVLVIGGCVGFLPVLGFWMVPVGLVLLRGTCRRCAGRAARADLGRAALHHLEGASPPLITPLR